MSRVIDKYNARVAAVNSLVCVGLDSDLPRLPERFQSESHSQFAFNQWIIQQTHPYASAYKLNTAFYEARGVLGWDEMAHTLAYLHTHHPDILTICDAKRADIGNTNSGYVTAIFDELGFDTVTLHPYLGGEALAPFLERVDRGCIILCRTSNPHSDELQGLMVGERPLWEFIAERVSTHWNTRGNCMLVVGATYPEDLRRVRDIVGEMPLLVPGVGAQGGDAATTVQMGQDAHGRGLIVNSSRGIIFADDPAVAAMELRDALNTTRTSDW